MHLIQKFCIFTSTMNKIKNDKWFSGLDYIEKVPEKLYILPDFLNMEVKEELAFARFAKWVKFSEPKEVIFYSKSKKKLFNLDSNLKVIGFTTFNTGGFIVYDEEKNIVQQIHSSEYSFVQFGDKTYFGTLLKSESNFEKLTNYFLELEKLEEQAKKVESLKNDIYSTFYSEFEELQFIFPKKRIHL